jgi:signal transduction histidine kinase
LPDRRSLKDLQSLLANTRQALPQDLPSAPILPDQLLREQRRSAHRAYLLLGLIISVTAAIATWAMGMETWWIAALLSAACALLYFGGERLPIPWMWRFRAFIAACLGAVSLDITLSGHDTAATSVAFLPLIIFYAGMLDSIPAASLTFLGGLALLLAEGLLTAQNLWPYYPSSLILIAFSSFTMVGIGWAVAPSLRERMATLSAEEEQLRASLHSYRKVVSTLFHDLANPLAVLQTLANLPPALLQPEDQDRALRMVERLEAVTQAARQQTQAPGAALQQSLIALDGDLHDLFQERLDARRLTLRVAGPTGFSLKVDPRLRDSLLGQLLSNAVRYAPEGGLILLSAEPHEGGLRLSLRDSGPGFPPETLKALARGAAPQPQPDARGEVGNGFGLLLASATARDLGGRLRLSNASGGGAQAELWLPG